jgi:hypothetical protein
LGLVALIGFNHVQGLGIAALGIAAVVVWRLIVWRRSMISWIALGAFMLSIATTFWYPRHPALKEIYLSQGWLTPLYGLNMFSSTSPAYYSAAAIIGAGGLLNLIAGLLLLRQNHVVAWLTLIPVIALYSPFVAIPLASILASRSVGEIIAYNRMLLSIPSGLALVCIGKSFYSYSLRYKRRLRISPAISIFREIPSLGLIGSLVIILTIPNGRPYYNRLWNSLVVTPSDIQFADVIKALDSQPSAPGSNLSLFLTSRAPGFIAVACGKTNNSPLAGRLISIAEPSQYLPWLAAALMETTPHASTTLLMAYPLGVSTSLSIAGYTSGHWQAQEVAISLATGPEKAALLTLGIQPSSAYAELVLSRTFNAPSSSNKEH